MRVIKFRAKETDGEWVYGELHLNCRIPHIHTDKRNSKPIDAATIGQYTGLVDMNGLEIYEGDIILHNDSTWCGVVQWHHNGYFFINDSYGKKYQRCDNYRSLGEMLDVRMFIVVGNIYDNKELFKGEQE